MIKDTYVESCDGVLAPAVEYRCKKIGTIYIPSITITLKSDFLFRKILLPLYKLSRVNSEQEWYTGSGFWHI